MGAALTLLLKAIRERPPTDHSGVKSFSENKTTHTHTQCSSTLGSFMYSVVSADSQNQRDFTFIFLSTWVHFLMQQSLAKLTWGCEAKGISTLVFKI